MNLHIETELEDDGRWIAEVPELPGALAYGASREGAVAAVEAGYARTRRAIGKRRKWRLKRANRKMIGMSVKKIEAAIAQLPRHEISELSRWFEELQNQVWDEQIERDANAGRLDKLIEQAKAQYVVGQCKPL